MSRRFPATMLAAAFALLIGCGRPAADTAAAQVPEPEQEETTQPAPGVKEAELAPSPGDNDPQQLPPPDKDLFPVLKRLNKSYDVWIASPEEGAKPDRVVLQAGVCHREGPLELFACIHQWTENPGEPEELIRRGTKEYESLVTVNTPAKLVHTGLLLVGAEAGEPVRFRPEYKAASGDRIEVEVIWKDDEGQTRRAKAQEWIRNTRTDEAMEHDWVFAGSRIMKNPQSGESQYMGENGNLICVSNFVDAVLDLPIESTQSNEALLFEAFTERIPPMGCPVTVVLKPVSEEGEME